VRAAVVRYDGHMSSKTVDHLAMAPWGAGRAARPSSAGATVLVVPGLNGSGPTHWQTIWQIRHPEFRRVEQASWDRPRLGDWASALERAVRRHRRVILVAHSLGCALVAHWARRGSTAGVSSALLVAPADVERPGAPSALRSFAPMPLQPLPFPSWVVASRDDPHATLARARAFADAWGARFLDAGPCGHINAESGHGEWADGEALLEEIRRSGRASPAWRVAGGLEGERT
jgi:serine hydrolase